MQQEASTDPGRKAQAGSLRDRLRFAGLDAGTCDTVRKHRQALEPHVQAALRDYFHRLQSAPDAARLFSSEHQIDRLHDLQSSHWSVLTDARFDSLYAERVKVLSDAESRMGIDPRWHMAGHAIVLEHVLCGLISEAWPKSILSMGKAKRQELSELVAALVRMIMVDAEISVSLRFNELRQANQRTLAEQRRDDASAVNALLAPVVRGLLQKDLSVRVTGDVPEGYEELAGLFNQALEDIEHDLSALVEKRTVIETSATALQSSAAAFAQSAERQSSGLSEAGRVLAEMAARVRDNARDTRSAEEAASATRKSAEKSGEIVGQAISAMADIETSAEKIGQIIGVIDEIAFQTNLLALNAGIEAARAGDSGRGFAVVAQEVRALAQRSGDAAREIKQLVTGTKEQVDAGVEMVARTQDAIGGIVQQVTDINAAIAGIAVKTSAEAEGLETVSADVGRIGQEVVSGARDASTAKENSDDLHTVILELGDTIRRFHVQHQSAAGKYAATRTLQASVPQPPARIEAAVEADAGMFTFDDDFAQGRRLAGLGG